MALTAGLGGGGSGRRRRGRPRRGALSEINVTPLVDVMLVLLIIFMISAPLLTAGVEVKLPKTEAPAIQAQDDPITVTVRQGGEIYVGEDPATFEQLGPRLEAMTRGNSDQPIFVRADASVPWDTVAKVMGRLKSSDFTAINLITDTGSEPPRAAEAESPAG